VLAWWWLLIVAVVVMVGAFVMVAWAVSLEDHQGKPRVYQEALCGNKRMYIRSSTLPQISDEMELDELLALMAGPIYAAVVKHDAEAKGDQHALR